MHHRFFLLLCLLASASAAEPLTPDAAARFALETNPYLAAARVVIAEAEARASGLGRLPNPEFATEFAAGSRERGRIELGLSQRFPRTARLRLERVVGADAIVLARLEVAAREADIAARAHIAVLDLAAVRAELRLVQQQAALAREFAQTQSRQVEQGQLSALDAAQARFVVREIELSFAELRAAEFNAAATLATLLGREADATITVDADLSLPADSPEPRLLGPRAEIVLAEQAIASGESDLSLARRKGQEDYSMGVFVEGEQSRADLGERERELMVGLRFSMPLPVRSVAAPAVAEKQAARRRLMLERDALALAVRNEVAATASILRARHASAFALADELLPAAREHLAATTAAHARGEMESAQLFRARERLTEIERADLAARRAYHLASIRHLAATGHLFVQP